MAAKAYITRHPVDSQSWSRLSSGATIAALGGHEGDSIDLDFTTGEQHMTTSAPASGLYEITIAGADARIKIGENAIADQTDQFWADGRIDVRFLHAGQRISVVAVS